jgi:hypothetical protein
MLVVQDIVTGVSSECARGRADSGEASQQNEENENCFHFLTSDLEVECAEALPARAADRRPGEAIAPLPFRGESALDDPLSGAVSGTTRAGSSFPLLRNCWSRFNWLP